MVRKKKTEVQTEPSVVIGSHLTVITYSDGRTELKWDDLALARDVKLALDSVKPVKKSKSKTNTK
jgi:hypothetical protein